MRKRVTPILLTLVLAATLFPALASAALKWGEFGSFGTATGQFNNPQGIAVDPSGNLYVADADNARIQLFSFTPQPEANAVFQLTWGTGGLGIGEFNFPSEVAQDADGNIYVSDTYNNRIVKYNSTGTVILLQWGSHGHTEGLFYYPRGIAVDNDGVYVADFYNKRMQMFTHLGVFVREWDVFGQYPWGVATDGFGAIYVTCNNGGYIEVFDNEGNELAYWGGFGATNGKFSGPRGIAVDALGNTYIADANNHRVQMFRM